MHSMPCMQAKAPCCNLVWGYVVTMTMQVWLSDFCRSDIPAHLLTHKQYS